MECSLRDDTINFDKIQIKTAGKDMSTILEKTGLPAEWKVFSLKPANLSLFAIYPRFWYGTVIILTDGPRLD